ASLLMRCFWAESKKSALHVLSCTIADYVRCGHLRAQRHSTPCRFPLRPAHHPADPVFLVGIEEVGVTRPKLPARSPNLNALTEQQIHDSRFRATQTRLLSRSPSEHHLRHELKNAGSLAPVI